ncbi:GntR family transcriptional regulator [Brevibacterium sp. CCUG 69071]|nr:GntR family transcriptional regulator [Brevibacterium sp. CCUG 69071]
MSPAAHGSGLSFWAGSDEGGDGAVTHDQARSAAIAAELRGRIIDGRLPPGTRIRQEEIAEEFGVSRLPIRETLRFLESSGLVTLVASTGAWVSRLDLEECREIYLMRERLEPLLLRLAMPGHTTESFVEFSRLAEAVAASTSRGELVERDRDFHRALTAGPATKRLRETVDHLWNLTHFYRRQLLSPSVSRRREDILTEHRMLLRAVEERDVDAAEATLALHIRHTRRLVERNPQIFESGEAPGTVGPDAWVRPDAP